MDVVYLIHMQTSQAKIKINIYRVVTFISYNSIFFRLFKFLNYYNETIYNTYLKIGEKKVNIFDLDENTEQFINKNEPLASRMRPTKLDEIVGQEHILGEGKLLSRAIIADQITSIILYGPPGTGKTTLARVIAATTKKAFETLNATTSGKHDMERVIKDAYKRNITYSRKTILFIDEIHRFNRAQQDFLLPYVENGTIILIGATTENPYFEVNGALLSRSRIFELLPLKQEDIKSLILRAIHDPIKGYGKENIEITDDALNFLTDAADGDARNALSALELAVTTSPKTDELLLITTEIASECIQKKIIRYDNSGDNHYDTIAAFIKSMCGSNPDAALYYLARMLEAGEDPKFIARRIMVAASEEVGNADPRAIEVATACALAVERIGLPEARINLAQAATYVACAPKSNASYLGIEKAIALVKETGNLPIPPHLKDSSYKGASSLGRGVGYKYAHNYPNHYVEQQYLPDEIKNVKIYELTDVGYEAKLKNYFRFIGKIK